MSHPCIFGFLLQLCISGNRPEAKPVKFNLSQKTECRWAFIFPLSKCYIPCLFSFPNEKLKGFRACWGSALLLWRGLDGGPKAAKVLARRWQHLPCSWVGGWAPAGGGRVGPGGGWTGTALQHMDELRFGWGERSSGLWREIPVHVVCVCMNESDPGACCPLGWSTREQTGKQMTTQSLLWRWTGVEERGDERMSHKGMAGMPGRAHK